MLLQFCRLSFWLKSHNQITWSRVQLSTKSSRRSLSMLYPCIRKKCSLLKPNKRYGVSQRSLSSPRATSPSLRNSSRTSKIPTKTNYWFSSRSWYKIIICKNKSRALLSSRITTWQTRNRWKSHQSSSQRNLRLKTLPVVPLHTCRYNCTVSSGRAAPPSKVPGTSSSWLGRRNSPTRTFRCWDGILMWLCCRAASKSCIQVHLFRRCLRGTWWCS